MGRSTRAAVAIAVLGALLLPTDASAAQLNASEDPTKKGPLAKDGGECDRDRARSGGELAARSKSCSDVYSFNPLFEDKERRDYGAVWLQANVDTEPGWCARSTTMEIKVPRGVRIEGRTPPYKRVEDPERVRARIVVDAGGTADQNGVLKNTFRLYPRRLKPDVDGRTLTVNWKGNTPKKLGFALGVEISWNADDGFPQASPRSSVTSSLDSC
jgi:hypothetical protein